MSFSFTLTLLFALTFSLAFSLSFSLPAFSSLRLLLDFLLSSLSVPLCFRFDSSFLSAGCSPALTPDLPLLFSGSLLCSSSPAAC